MENVSHKIVQTKERYITHCTETIISFWGIRLPQRTVHNLPHT
jgi:hypothetical protein